jgi:hypothetical protein
MFAYDSDGGHATDLPQPQEGRSHVVGRFDDEMDKLDHWAEDKRIRLKTDLREHDGALKSLKCDARQSAILPEKLAIQKKIKQVEGTREEAWRAYDAEAARSRQQRRP